MSTNTSTVNVDIITAYKGAANVKKAQTELEKLGAAAKKLGLAFGIAFAGREIVNFGKASIQAFANNEKQVALLANTMKNLGQEFAAADVNKFIDSLALASGRTKEELIPAFQGLFIATGDAAKAQDALKLAMDVSAGTGKDLQTVQMALSKGFLGNTTSLTRLGAGLDKTILATKNMDLITAQLAKNFSGDSAVAANSFQGELDRLNVTMTEAKVIIGTDLVQAFKELSGSNGIGSSQSAILSFANNIGAAIVGTERLIKIVAMFVTANKGLKDYIASYKAADALELAKKNQTTTIATSIAVANKASIAAAQAKAKADAAALVTLNAQKKAVQDKLKAERDSLNLKLAGSTIDMQNIEIQAALQRGQTQQVSDVLLLQRAILNGNADQAEVLAQKVLRANNLVMDVAGNISALGSAKDPFKDWPTQAQSALDQIKLMLAELTMNAIKIPIVPVVTPPTGSTTAGTDNGTALSDWLGSGRGTGDPSISSSVTSMSSDVSTNPYVGYTGADLGNMLGSGRGTNDITITVQTADGAVLAATQAQSTNGTAVMVNRNQPLAQYQ